MVGLELDVCLFGFTVVGWFGWFNCMSWRLVLCLCLSNLSSFFTLVVEFW